MCIYFIYVKVYDTFVHETFKKKIVQIFRVQYRIDIRTYRSNLIIVVG